MDEAQGCQVHQGNARTQRTQQEDESPMHERVDEEIEVGSLEVGSLEVLALQADCEALDVELTRQELREEVEREETRLQIFALTETSLELKDERSS